MATIIELIIVLLSSFGFNMIPFAGPSNLFIASNAALIVPSAGPVTIGILVALGASFAKSIHYMVTFYVSKRLSEERRKRLDADVIKIRKWAFPLLFVAAASPIPDEPIVIPLGLMKYSPTKFFTAYFLGKLTIGVAGAYLGGWSLDVFSGILSQSAIIIISIVLTIVVTIILLKVDFSEFVEKYLRKNRNQSSR